MALLKELHLSAEIVNESILAGDAARLKKMFDTLETNLDRVGSQLKTDSQFAKQVAKIGGDTKHLGSIIKKFDSLFDEVMDLIQYTDLNGDQE
jgi:hypothetical protein